MPARTRVCYRGIALVVLRLFVTVDLLARARGARPLCPSVDRMHPDLALHMMADLFWTGLVVCAPVLGLTMAVGLVISVLQVVTQVQEMSLTFVPKLLAAGIALVVFGAWMLRHVVQFAIQLWAGIPSMF